MNRRTGKRLLSWILTVLLMFSAVPLSSLPVMGAAGNTTEFLDGDGTEENPYLISNKTHLNNVRKYLDAHFKMVADIEFTDADFAEGGEFYNDGQGWEPIGNSDSSAFTGTFDGDGHTITALICNRKGGGEVYAGLFGYNTGHIQNVGMADGTIFAKTASPSSPVHVGGIVGYNDGTLASCSNTSNMIANSFNDSALAGGITGCNGKNGTIINCYNTGTISSTSAFYYRGGGITGINNGMISSCYNTGSITAVLGSSLYAGGIVGYNSDIGTIDNCYNAGKINAVSTVDAVNACPSAGGIAGMGQGMIRNCYSVSNVSASVTENAKYARAYIGGIIGTSSGAISNCYYFGENDKGVGSGNDPTVRCTYSQIKQATTFVGFDFDATWTFVSDKIYSFPVLRHISYIAKVEIEQSTGFLDGFGTEENPYLISNKNHLNNVRNHLNAHFKMVANIQFTEADFAEGGDFYNDGQGWEPIGNNGRPAFNGSFDGNGHVITGLVCNRTGTGAVYAGLFGYNKGGIFNLMMVDSNVSAVATVESDFASAGNIAAVSSGNIYNCSNIGGASTAAGKSFSEAGGIVGRIREYGKVSNCYNTGDVSASYAGGITGRNYGIIDDCYNTGSIRGGSGGGIAGLTSNILGLTHPNFGTITSCYNTGHVTAGGIVGTGEHDRVLYCYYLDTAVEGIGGSDTDTATKCTVDQMKQQSTFAGFDFDAVWEIDGYHDYPYPQLKNNRQEPIRSIELLTSPTNGQLIEGLLPDLSGATVKILYEDGFEITTDVTSQMLSELDIHQLGVQTVHLTYGGKTTAETIDVEVIPKSIVSMAVTTPPAKTTYVQGQPLNPAGGRLTIYYNNNTSEEVDLSVAQLSYTASQPGDTTATAVYQGFEADFSITVTERIVKSISLIEPTKLSYIEGQPLDLTGGKLRCTYESDDHYTEEIPLDLSMISGYKPDALGIQTLTVTYAEQTATFIVSVRAKALTEICLTAPPDKTSYIEGDPFNPAGMVVTAYYDNGTSEAVTDFTLSGYDSTPGAKTITVTYGGKTTSFEVTVTAKSLTHIDVTKQPDKTAYLEGDVFDRTGLEITAYYDNGTSEAVTDFTLSGYTSTPGAKTITVTYGGKTTSFEVTVTAKSLTHIAVTKQPDKTAYLEGDAFDHTGLEITAYYDNGTSETVTAFTLSGYDSTPGAKTITVTYGGKTATFEVTVRKKSLQSISITKNPSKMIYVEGTPLDTTGMELTLAYDNGTTEILITGWTETYDFSQTGQRDVVISCQGKTVTLTVTVISKTLTGIAVTKQPIKQIYLEGEAFDPAGLVIIADYNNGTSAAVTDYRITGYNPSVVGQQFLTVTYEGKTAGFTVTVNAKSVSSIEWKSRPSKTTYYLGEELSLKDAVVLIRYNNGTADEKNLEHSSFGADQFHPNKLGKQIIYIQIDGAPAISFTVTVQSRVPSSITSSTYSISGGFISKVGAGTTVSQLLNGLNEKAWCKVCNGNSEVSGSTLIGSGMTVKLLDGSTVKQTLTVVVTGDVNGDGNITITDMLAVKSHLLKKSILSGAQAKAADTSGDKAISITDFIQIKAHILGKDKTQPRAC